MYVSFRFLFSSLLIATSLQVSSQIKIHSHNDYSRSVPFYLAYSQNASIIEADVFISENGKNLFVANDREDIDPSLTIEKLYLDPIADIYKRNNGKMWKDNDNEMVLMIDLKTSYEKTLPLLRIRSSVILSSVAVRCTFSPLTKSCFASVSSLSSPLMITFFEEEMFPISPSCMYLRK